MNYFLLYLSLSFSASVFIVLLLLGKPFFKKHTTKKWQYYIWLIVILRLMIPYTPPYGSFMHFLFSNKTTIQTTATQTKTIINPNTTDTITKETTDTITPPYSGIIKGINNTVPSKQTNFYTKILENLWLIWPIGAISLFVIKIRNYRRFISIIKSSRTKISDTEIQNVYKKACSTLNIKHPPPLYTSNYIVSPMIAGVFRTFILLTEHKFSKEQLYYVFLHELTHYKRFDMQYKWLIQIALCFHWFNPLVFAASRQIEQYCELSCDEAVIKSIGAEEKKLYGDMLIFSLKSNGGYHHSGAITLNENVLLLKERLRSIMDYKKKTRKMALLASIFTVIFGISAVSTGVYGASKTKNTLPKVTTEKTTDTPQETFETAMKALKNLDMEIFNASTDNFQITTSFFGSPYKRYVLFGALSTKEDFPKKESEREFDYEIVKNLSWKLLETTQNQNTAQLKAQITNKDFSNTVGYFTADIMENVANSLGDDEKQTDDINLIDYVKTASGNITLDITLTANYIDDKWILHIDDSFSNAVFGNMQSGGENYSKKVQSRIDAAEKMIEKKTEELTEKSMGKMHWLFQ